MMSCSDLIYKYNLFDFDETSEDVIESKFKLTDDDISHLKNYSVEKYCLDIEMLGLEETWQKLCAFVLQQNDLPQFFRELNYGELYETGLALQDKNEKKSSGQYYTPQDVALVMCEWFCKLEAENICDVACGTGNLILAYLKLIGDENAKNLISSGKIYLYDNDEIALKICKTLILLKYGKEFDEKIHAISCDFLDRKIMLPKNCKVISNPPYAKIKNISYRWSESAVINSTKEFYAAFIEKIVVHSECSVIITPYSFIGGNKFFPLRKLMNDFNGFIVSFDNVPGNIFSGRKHGIFNSNTSNSVRAAITVVENKKI